MERCTLCGGKLRSGRCTECGLDNNKNDKKYHLNIHNEKDSFFHHKNCEDNLNRDCEDSRNWGKAQKIPASKKTAGTVASKRVTGPLPQAKPVQKQVSKVQRSKEVKKRHSTGTVKSGSSLVRLILIIVILTSIVSCAIPVFLAFRDEIPGDAGDRFQNYLSELLGEEISGTVSAPSDEITDEKLDKLTAEEPDYIAPVEWDTTDPDYFEMELSAGIYEAGYEIPAGTYQIYCESSSAWIYYTDEPGGDFTGYVSLYSRELQKYCYQNEGMCEAFEYSQVLELEEGDRICVSYCFGGLRLQGYGSSVLKEHDPQRLKGNVELSEGMVAGKDFEPGIYDVSIKCDDDVMPYIEIEVISEDDDATMYISLSDESPTFYRNEFRKGDQISVTAYGDEKFDILLTPSF